MKYPNEFHVYFRNPSTRAAFISTITSTHAGDCANCGGVGRMFVFVATVGPLNSAPAGAVCHFADGKWWGGSTFSHACPVCLGTGQDKTYIEKPYVYPGELVAAAIKELAEVKG